MQPWWQRAIRHSAREPVSDGVADPLISVEYEACKKQQVEGETKTRSLQGAFCNPQKQEADKGGKKDGGPLVAISQTSQQPAYGYCQGQ